MIEIVTNNWSRLDKISPGLKTFPASVTYEWVSETPLLTHRSYVILALTHPYFNDWTDNSFPWADNFSRIILNTGQGLDSICHLTGIGNPIVEVRRSNDHLISPMGFPILVRQHFYIGLGPRCPSRMCVTLPMKCRLPSLTQYTADISMHGPCWPDSGLGFSYHGDGTFDGRWDQM